MRTDTKKRIVTGLALGFAALLVVMAAQRPTRAQSGDDVVHFKITPGGKENDAT